MLPGGRVIKNNQVDDHSALGVLQWSEESYVGTRRLLPDNHRMIYSRLRHSQMVGHTGTMSLAMGGFFVTSNPRAREKEVRTPAK